MSGREVRPSDAGELSSNHGPAAGSAAERAVLEPRRAGVSDGALSDIAHHGGTMTTTGGDGEITDETHRNVLRGVLGGGALGAGLAVATLAIGAAAGAAAGTLNETLTKHGVSKEDAGYYNDRMKDGAVFVAVDLRWEAVDPESVRDILYRDGGHSSSRMKSAIK